MRSSNVTYRSAALLVSMLVLACGSSNHPSTADPVAALARAQAVEIRAPSAAAARPVRLALKLGAQPREVKQARVRVARERAAVAVAELEAREAKQARVRVVREQAEETAEELEARQARQRRNGRRSDRGQAGAELAEQWPLEGLARGGTSSSTTALVNNYDGARSTTVSFDQGWKVPPWRRHRRPGHDFRRLGLDVFGRAP